MKLQFLYVRRLLAYKLEVNNLSDNLPFVLFHKYLHVQFSFLFVVCIINAISRSMCLVTFDLHSLKESDYPYFDYCPTLIKTQSDNLIVLSVIKVILIQIQIEIL